QRDLAIPDETLRAMVRHYTLEAGVRGLQRQIATLCRKVARARATGDALRHQVTQDKLERYLGHRIYAPETAGKNDAVGAAAGVPKDAPAAGVTVGLVIASVLSDRPIRHDVAMTGEVSLRGRVLVVGGLREKALASYRAGFRAMLFPAANVKDIDDIPPDVR